MTKLTTQKNEQTDGHATGPEAEANLALERLKVGSYENVADAINDIRTVLGLGPLNEQGLEAINNLVKLIDPYAPKTPNIENCSPQKCDQKIEKLDGYCAVYVSSEHQEHTNKGGASKILEETLELALDRLSLVQEKAAATTIPQLYLLIGLDVVSVQQTEYIRRTSPGERRMIVRNGDKRATNILTITTNEQRLGEVVGRLATMGITKISLGESVILLDTASPASHMVGAVEINVDALTKILKAQARLENFVQNLKQLSMLELQRLLKREVPPYVIANAVRECFGLETIPISQLDQNYLQIVYSNGWETCTILEPDVQENIPKPQSAVLTDIKSAINKLKQTLESLVESYNESEDPFVMASTCLTNK